MIIIFFTIIILIYLFSNPWNIIWGWNPWTRTGWKWKTASKKDKIQMMIFLIISVSVLIIEIILLSGL